MTGRVMFQDMIRRTDLQANPRLLYVFGDNMAGRGYGGQAREMRGEPNAVGIPTKHAPSNKPDAFFSDTDAPKVLAVIDARFDALTDHLESGGDVVMPTDGVGTGRARLRETAPAIDRHLKHRMKILLDHYGVRASPYPSMTTGA